MIGPKGQFFFYLAALICFLVATASETRGIGRFGRGGVAVRLGFVPLGLAFWIFPLMWNTGQQAF